MSGLIVFYDANVLYPAELRNLLMHLAITGLFRAKWPADVHEEWISNLLQARPDLTRDKLERTRMLMDKHATDALVTGYRDLISQLQLPDPEDRHVLAAAIRGQASVIVTMNLRDFPARLLSPWGLEAQHPDAFVLRLLEWMPDTVAARKSLKNPSKTESEYLETLENQGLRQTASQLRRNRC